MSIFFITITTSVKSRMVRRWLRSLLLSFSSSRLLSWSWWLSWWPVFHRLYHHQHDQKRQESIQDTSLSPFLLFSFCIITRYITFIGRKGKDGYRYWFVSSFLLLYHSDLGYSHTFLHLHQLLGSNLVSNKAFSWLLQKLFGGIYWFLWHYDEGVLHKNNRSYIM